MENPENIEKKDPVIDYSEYTLKSLEHLRQEQKGFRERKRAPKPMSESEKKYWDKVRDAPDPFDTTRNIGEALRNLLSVEPKDLGRANISFDEGRNLLFQVIKLKQQRQGWKYIFTDDQKRIINDLIRYFIGDTDSSLNLSKGIFLWGDVGRGKTQVLHLFCEFARALKFKRFDVASSKGIVYDMSKESSTEPLGRYFTKSICFDDFGFEEQTYKVYGNEIRAMETIIEQRYISHALTHCTSNISPVNLHKLYDQRIVSRINEMMNFVEFKGIDHRKE